MLSDFIRANTASILLAWEQFARQIPLAREMDIAALRDHASGILQAIIADLETAQTLSEQEAKSKGLGPKRPITTEATMHGAARMLEGFSVNAALSEFRALRASVLRLWIASDPSLNSATVEEMTRFNEAIDQALAESVERYSADKDYYTRLFDGLLSSSPDLNFILDPDESFIYVNKALADLHGTSAKEIVGKSIDELALASTAKLHEQLAQAKSAKTMFRGEMSFLLPSGSEACFEYILIPILNEKGTLEAIAGSARDITERKQHEDKVIRAANYDALTELPNRNLFHDRLERDLKHAARTGLPVALLFVDLDGFKEVNDRLGHDAGDQLLRQAAWRISGCVRDMDTVARLGGDEFTVILAEIRQASHIEILARKILDELAEPFLIGEEELRISGSIGIAFYPQDAAAPDELLRNADQAMYMAKRAGRNRFSFFTVALRDPGTGNPKPLSR
jgi:diguanylate cyclase (GGDEF)-like protein/PAS domain S-box-containing protein